MANCVCAMCKRIMDCTGEIVCVLCEVIIENEQERAQHDMTLQVRPIKPNPSDEVWDTQP